ncbi:MAG: hypothetical protein V9E96_09390 [Chitinophagaceae bacterium]|jgi:hypothetical protein|nr:hypothetical protein [Chitinophagaceae bacterium]MBP9739065.1 hypothetical protein [Chitinophagaceae bacterium]
MKHLLKKLKFKKIESLIYINKPNDLIVLPEIKYTHKIYDEGYKTNIAHVDGKKFFKAYVVLDGNKFVHVSCIFKNNLLAKQLGYKNAYTIGECVTSNIYKGQGIYPVTLTKIKIDFKNDTLIVFVQPNNIASIKGIEKAGFHKLYQFIMYRFLGINLYTKKF